MKMFLPFQPITWIWVEEQETFLGMPVSECETLGTGECSTQDVWTAPLLILCLGNGYGSMLALKDLALKRRTNRGNIHFKHFFFALIASVFEQTIHICHSKFKSFKRLYKWNNFLPPINVTHVSVPLLEDFFLYASVYFRDKISFSHKDYLHVKHYYILLFNSFLELV